jgi:hypothetical protein
VRFGDLPVVPFTFAHDAGGRPGQPGIDRVTFAVAFDGEPSAVPECQPTAPPPLAVDPDRADPHRLEAAIQVHLPCNGVYRITAAAHTPPRALYPEETSPPADLVFSTAIPAAAPTDVAAEPADLEGDAAARVTWTPPNPAPPDLVGYVVQRSRSADAGFEEIAASVEPSFVDGEAAEGGTFYYRVQSVRLGPGGDPEQEEDLIASEPSSAASVDVPVPPDTRGDPTTDPTGADGGAGAPTARPRGDLSGFGALQQQAARLRPGAAPPRAVSPPTTVDTGFQPTLPFGPGNPNPDPDSNAAAPPTSGPGDGLAAGGSLQTFEDGPGDRKAVLAPVAGALALLMVFLQLRWLLRQASTA